MLYQSCWNNLVTGLIVPSSLSQFVNSFFQTCSNKFGTSSANTSCQQLVNGLVTTCLQVCSNLFVFTCVGRCPRPKEDVNRIVFTSSSERQCFFLFIKKNMTVGIQKNTLICFPYIVC